MANSKNGAKKSKIIPSKNLQAALAIALILSGFFLIFWSLKDKLIVFQRPKVENSFQSANQVQNQEIKPYKLYIPKIGKILYISDGAIVDDRWVISNSGVSYLTVSALPGKVGNSVLYGHNLDNILGKLPNLAEGDLIYVVMTDGKFYKYSVFERKEVGPNAVEILNNSNDARITIYTCSGFLDSARFVVVGKLVS